MAPRCSSAIQPSIARPRAGRGQRDADGRPRATVGDRAAARARGNSRRVAGQFFGEALLLASLGGVLGVAVGLGIGAAYATTQAWPVVISPVGIAIGIGASAAVGSIAGLYPALRAAGARRPTRSAPRDALRTA